jgi:hypothetical protein
MSSLLPGFEYNIFIIYRQKDNKNDGWVTEFVPQNHLYGSMSLRLLLNGFSEYSK